MIRSHRKLFFAATLLAVTAHAQQSIEPPLIEAAVDLATLLESRHGETLPPATPWFATLRGTQPVIVTATHATRPFREGRFRFADGGGTGALAHAPHGACGATVLYTVYDSPSDPNFYDNNEFKTRLGELIAEIRPAIVLDIHGSNAYRPYDVDLGTMNGQSVAADPTIVPRLTAALRAAGLANVSDNHFPGTVNRTIVRYAHARGIPAVQLEFSVTRTAPQESRLGGHLFAQALEALVRFLEGRGGCVPAATGATAAAASPP